MSIAYRLMYLVGFKPWDTDRVPAELADLVEGPAALPAGRALDIGCGTGTQAVYLARHGWQVTGIDVVDKPLERARRRAEQAGVSVELLKADVARLAGLGIAPGVSLFHDRGCYHGLPEPVRDVYAQAVTELAAPGATLLLMAFARNRVLVGPSGVEDHEVAERIEPGWELVYSGPDRGRAPAGPMRDVPLTWYRLVRR